MKKLILLLIFVLMIGDTREIVANGGEDEDLRVKEIEEGEAERDKIYYKHLDDEELHPGPPRVIEKPTNLPIVKEELLTIKEVSEPYIITLIPGSWPERREALLKVMVVRKKDFTPFPCILYVGKEPPSRSGKNLFYILNRKNQATFSLPLRVKKERGRVEVWLFKIPTDVALNNPFSGKEIMPTNVLNRIFSVPIQEGAMTELLIRLEEENL